MIDLLRREENDLILLEIINAKKSIETIFDKLLQDLALKFNVHQLNENPSYSTQFEEEIVKIKPLENGAKQINFSSKIKLEAEKICFRCNKKFRKQTEFKIHLIKHKYNKIQSKRLKGLTVFKRKSKQKSFKKLQRKDADLKVDKLTIPNVLPQNKVDSLFHCDSNFTTSNNLTVHDLIHSNVQLHECDQCKMKLTTSSALSRHKRIHSNETSLQCDECEMKFTKLANLRNHKRIHSGERPYGCDQCKYRCIKSSDLTKHKRMHTGEKPYQCDQCEMKFSDSCNLLKHKRTHLKEQPFECDQCKMKFTRLNYLMTHKRTYHAERSLECDQFEKKRNMGQMCPK